MSIPVSATCTTCAAVIPADAPGGVCPACELRAALDAGGLDADEVLGNLGGYELLEEVGRGGMGTVWRARQPGLGRTVAVKILPGGEWAGASARARFRREAEAAASLRHPNIVAVHDCGEHEGTLWYSMDFIEGEELSAHIARSPMPAGIAAAMLEKMARAVAHAHDHRIWHRDLKPANVLVDAAGEPHITDFGLAHTGAATGLTISGHVAGSPHYLPPERIAGPNTVHRTNEPHRPYSESDAPGDIYALGATLYHMLTGQPPFRGGDVAAILAKVTVEAPVRPSSLVPGLPRDLENICLKCLEKAPAARYTTAEALAEDLRRFRIGEPVLARPIGALTKLARWSRRRPGLAALSAALLLALAGLVAVLALSARRATAHAGELSTALTSAQQAQRSAEAASRAARRDQLISESARTRKGLLFQSWRESLHLLREAAALHQSNAADPAATRRLRDEYAAALAMPETDVTEPAKPVTLPHENQYWVGRERRWRMMFGPGPRNYWLLSEDTGRAMDIPVKSLGFHTLASPDSRWIQTQYWSTPAPESDLWDISGETPVCRTVPGQLVCFSPDNRHALQWAGGKWGIYSLADGTSRTAGDTTFIHRAAWRPDGRAIAICRNDGKSGNAPGSVLVLVNVFTLETMWERPLPEPAVAIAWNDDGSRIAVMDQPGRIQTFCRSLGLPGRAMIEPGGTASDAPATGIHFAPGGLLVSHSKAGTCSVWDTASGSLLRSELRTISPCFENGRRADGAMGPIQGRNIHATWFKVRNSIWRHIAISAYDAAGPLHGLHWSPDSRHLAAGGESGTCIWDTGKSALSGLNFVPGLLHGAVAAWGPCTLPLGDSGLLACYESGLWRTSMADADGRTLGLCIRPGVAAAPYHMARAAQSGHVAAAVKKDARAEVEFFHPDKPDAVRTITLPGPANALALSPDGTVLAAGYYFREHQLRLYNTGDGTVIFTQHNMGVAPNAVQFSGDGRQLAFNSCNAHLLDRATHVSLGEFSTWSRLDTLAATPAVSLDQCGKWFAVTDPPRRIILHRRAPVGPAAPGGWSPFITLESPSGMGLTRLSLSPDGKTLAAATTTASFELWDLARLEEELKTLGLWE